MQSVHRGTGYEQGRKCVKSGACVKRFELWCLMHCASRLQTMSGGCILEHRQLLAPGYQCCLGANYLRTCTAALSKSPINKCSANSALPVCLLLKAQAPRHQLLLGASPTPCSQLRSQHTIGSKRPAFHLTCLIFTSERPASRHPHSSPNNKQPASPPAPPHAHRYKAVELELQAEKCWHHPQPQQRNL